MCFRLLLPVILVWPGCGGPKNTSRVFALAKNLLFAQIIHFCVSASTPNPTDSANGAKFKFDL